MFPLVLRAGGGSARDTLSVLDQLLAGAGPEGVTYERAVALLGVTDVALIDDVVDALAAGDRAAVFETVDRLVEAGLDPRRFAADLLQRLRDLTLVQAIPDAAQRGLVDAARTRSSAWSSRRPGSAPRRWCATARSCTPGLIEMRGATAPRLLLELLCARMLLPAASTGEPALLERLERIERRASIAPAPVPGRARRPPADATRRARSPEFVRSDGGSEPAREPAPRGRMSTTIAAPDEPTMQRPDRAACAGGAPRARPRPS